MNQVFINQAFTKAINDYQLSKNDENGILYNSFLTMIIRMLVLIYSELDLINPIITSNEEALKDNLAKFGYSSVDIDEFFNDLNNYYLHSKKMEECKIKEENPYFIKIQKSLIDMLICKKMNFHISDPEIVEFFGLLYTSKTKNPLRISEYYLNTPSNLANEVENYFIKQMKENVKIVEEREKNILNVKAYEILNYNMDKINSMSADEVDKLNHQVYDYFKIRENAINKEYLLDKALSDLEREKNKLTSGNGYVDILLVMSVIVTTIMLVCVVSFLVI